jgi:CRP-like cAMP-binding protein
MAGPRIHQNGHNRLLSLLPKKKSRDWIEALERIPLAPRQRLYDVGEPIDYVYFPIGGVVSLVVDPGEKPVEVATVGNEGFIGTPLFLGAKESPTRAFAQVAGEALRTTASRFQARLKADSTLHRIMERYLQALINQISQTVACNQVHSVEQRMCRWLLITHDRVNEDEFALTQDFLAQMLGVRRSTVSVIAALLQRQGLIAYHHGRIRIVDRRRLETASCNCYRIVKKEYERLLDGRSG